MLCFFNGIVYYRDDIILILCRYSGNPYFGLGDRQIKYMIFIIGFNNAGLLKSSFVPVKIMGAMWKRTLAHTYLCDTWKSFNLYSNVCVRMSVLCGKEERWLLFLCNLSNYIGRAVHSLHYTTYNSRIPRVDERFNRNESLFRVTAAYYCRVYYIIVINDRLAFWTVLVV